MTRAEYQAKYGTPPPVASAPVQMTRQQYQQKYGSAPGQSPAPAPQQQGMQFPSMFGLDRNTVAGKAANFLPDIGVGIGQTVAKAGLGLGETALKGIRALGVPSVTPVIDQLHNIKQNVYEKPLTDSEGTLGRGLGNAIGTAATFLAPSKYVTGAQAAITKGVGLIPAATKTAQFARGALGVVARAVPEALSTGASSLALSGGDTQTAQRDALIGGGLSAGFGTLGALGRGAKSLDVTKNVLSSTSGIPKGAMDEVAQKGIDTSATPEKALTQTRNAVHTLRTNLSTMWNQRVPQLADEYKDVRMGLSENEASNLGKVADEFGLDEKYIPQNIKSMSVKESLDLMKGLNGLDSKAVALSPKGAVARQLRQELRSKVLGTFGGEKGSVAKLWGEYAAKSGIHDSVDNIVRAYISNKPISDVTAKNRLMAIFDENKPEYLKAIKDIEKELGVDIKGQVASTKFGNLLPSSILKADGGLPTKAGAINKIIDLLALPLTSPKLVGKAVAPATKEAGPLGKRLFGDYNPITSASANSSKSSASISPASSNTSKSMFSIYPTIPQPQKSASYLQEMLQKAKDEGQKGMIRNPLASKDSLIAEAKKYKSAEEFVKAQGTPVYRASEGGFDASKIGDDGAYVSPSKQIASSFSEGGKRQVDELYISPNAKVLEWKDVPDEFKNFDGKDIYEEQRKLSQYARSNGYDVVGTEPKFEYTKGIEQQVVNPNVLKTRSQLTDIWNQANNSQRGFIKNPFKAMSSASEKRALTEQLKAVETKIANTKDKGIAKTYAKNRDAIKRRLQEL